MIEWVWLFVDRPMDRYAEATSFWGSISGSGTSPRRGADGEFLTLLPPMGDAWLKVQGVRAGGGAHLDLEVDDVDASLEAAVALGATVVTPHDGWAVLASPSGQLFCLLPSQATFTRAPAFVQPDGSSSRVDQFSIDIAPAAYDEEVAFWRGLTGWEWRQLSHPEFSVVQPPASIAVRILLQRLVVARPTSAHLDIACADPEATRGWHESLGARLLRRGSSWLVMEDPAGGTYCLTERDPGPA